MTNFSPQTDRHVIVSYHYIEPYREGRKGIHPCPPDEFERQVAFLNSRYRLASVPDVYRAAQEKSSESVCALTFDDGLKDQYEYAVPVLKKYNAAATFFVITGTLDGFIPATHQMHLLLSLVPIAALLEDSRAFLRENGLNLAGMHHISRETRLNPARSYFDDIPTANFKEVVTRMPQDIKTAFLDKLFEKHNIQTLRANSSLFMDEEDARNLYELGFHIGSHTNRHEALDTLTRDDVRQTLALSSRRIMKITGTVPNLFCYPQGGTSSTAEEELQIHSFTHGVTIEERAVSSTDTPYRIPRYDTVRVRAFLNKQNMQQ